MVFITSFLYFIFGLLRVYSYKFDYTLYVFLSISMFSIVLKVLWTGGYFSSYFVWLFFIPFILNLIYKSKFFVVFSLINIFAALTSLLFNIKLDQFKYLHVLFKLSGFNILLLYSLPFLLLIIITIYFKRDRNKGDILYSLFASEFDEAGLMLYLKNFDLDINEIKKLSDNRFLLKKAGQLEKLETCLSLIDFKISNYSQTSELNEVIIEYFEK